MPQRCKILKTTALGMVLSYKLVVILWHKHFTSRHSNVFNPINIIMNCGAHSSTVCSDCATNQLRFDSRCCCYIFYSYKQAGCTIAWGLTQLFKNEYQEYFLECKHGEYVRLTTWPPSCSKCMEIWEPQPPGTLSGLQEASTETAVTLLLSQTVHMWIWASLTLHVSTSAYCI